MGSAEIFCHPNGKWLYVSNRDVAGRGRDSLTVFDIGADGKLTWRQNVSAGVKIPRGFDIDPTGQWLVVGGQSDNKITVFKISPATGELSATNQTAAVGAPVCVVFAPAKN
jgi:6-phosphogluconolactonase